MKAVLLNLGCGPHYAEGWTNVDRFDTFDRSPDVVYDVRDGLVDRFGVQSARRIFIGHMLEHVAVAEAAATVIQAYSVLQPGGEICLVGPDVVKMAEAVHAGERTWEDFWDAHGRAGEGQNWNEGYQHAWSCTEEALALLLIHAGFQDITAHDPFKFWEHRSEHGWPIVSGASGQAIVIGRRKR